MSFDSLRIALANAVNDVFPGASVAVYKDDKLVYEEAFGYAETVPSRRNTSIETLYDLASLTKPLAASIVTARLMEEGLLHLKQRVSEVLPEYSATNAGHDELKSRTEIWMLLSHSAGLPAWAPLYKLGKSSREELLEEAARSFINCPPGSNVVYSDIGYIVLTAILERVAGERIDRLFEKLVAKPLGLRKTVYNPLSHGFSENEIASTETDPATGLPLTGVVHDENARALGGLSGHAGLFSVSKEVGLVGNQLLQAYLGKSDCLVKKATAATMLSPWVGDDYCYGLGWQVYRKTVTQAFGDLMTDGRAFGHTGFTGTSICIDVEQKLVAVLLSNRVHPSRENNKIMRFRPVFHNLLVSSL
ncbi:MAG: serine hydrolase [Thaumarchaeota archaeon]|jgi:CubicO group peptidase (beta-lactamase class C family)|nr:serine hydrolase [Nitrososphaerota archaeon]